MVQLSSGEPARERADAARNRAAILAAAERLLAEQPLRGGEDRGAVAGGIRAFAPRLPARQLNHRSI